VAEWHGTNVFLRDGEAVYERYRRLRPGDRRAPAPLNP
jgi:hypothetical protein